MRVEGEGKNFSISVLETEDEEINSNCLDYLGCYAINFYVERRKAIRKMGFHECVEKRNIMIQQNA
jgi:hypothetical protein